MMDQHPPADFYSNVLAQLSPPAQVAQYRPSIEKGFIPGVPNREIDARELGLKTLKANDGTIEVKCHFQGSKCYRFQINRNGTLGAVFVYDTDGRGNIAMLDHIINLRGKQKAFIFYYMDNKNEEKIEDFWKDPENIAYVILDTGLVEQEIKEAFEKFSKKK